MSNTIMHPRKTQLINQLDTIDLAKLKGYGYKFGPEVESDLVEFKQKIHNLDLDPNGDVIQGEPFTLERIVTVNKGKAVDVFCEWHADQNRAREARRAQEFLENSVEIEEWKGEKFNKPKRIHKDDAKWEKPGHTVVSTPLKAVLDSNYHDSDMGQFYSKTSTRTKKIGTELPEGTIKAKRIITPYQGAKTVEYLVKPRSQKAEKIYQAQMRMIDLQETLQINRDMMSESEVAQIRAEIDTLKKQVGGK